MPYIPQVFSLWDVKICLSVSGSVLFVIPIITVMLMLLSIFFVSD